MRFTGVALLASCLSLPTLIGLLTHPDHASAQTIQLAEAAKKGKTATKKSGPNQGANLPLVERIGIQLDLAFTGGRLDEQHVGPCLSVTVGAFERTVDPLHGAGVGAGDEHEVG